MDKSPQPKFIKAGAILALLVSLSLRAAAEEQLALITTLGDHTLAPGLRLLIRENGSDPLSYTIGSSLFSVGKG